MSKIAIIGKQQPLVIRERIKVYLESEGHTAELLYMPTRNASDWIDELRGYNAIISAGEKFPGIVFESLRDDLALRCRHG